MDIDLLGLDVAGFLLRKATILKALVVLTRGCNGLTAKLL